jgi:hypothetical protein
MGADATPSVDLGLGRKSKELKNKMNKLVKVAFAVCSAGILFSFTPAGDCNFAQGQVLAVADGSCAQWAANCSSCCRHSDIDTLIPICLGGNQYENCTEQPFPMNAQVNFCSGDVCDSAGVAPCTHEVTGGLASSYCPQPH